MHASIVRKRNRIEIVHSVFFLSFNLNLNILNCSLVFKPIDVNDLIRLQLNLIKFIKKIEKFMQNSTDMK